MKPGGSLEIIPLTELVKLFSCSDAFIPLKSPASQGMGMDN